MKHYNNEYLMVKVTVGDIFSVAFMNQHFNKISLNFAFQRLTRALLTAPTSSDVSFFTTNTTVLVNPDFQVWIVTLIVMTAAQIHVSMESVSTV